MTRLLLAALFSAGCGTAPDDRPATLEVVTLEVLAPTCGQVQCHSTTTNTAGYALDTVAAARGSLPGLLDVRRGGMSRLVEVITASGGNRMPPDSPLASEDIALIEAWIAAGTPGL